MPGLVPSGYKPAAIPRGADAPAAQPPTDPSYELAAIPQPGEEAYGPTDARGGAGAEEAGYGLVSNQRLPSAVGVAVTPPELRVVGEDRRGFQPAWAFFLRTDRRDADWDLANDGVHVAQVPGAAIAHGTQAPQAPLYGATFRLEPQPADAGWYVGSQA
jgi:hypothetical protein